MIRLRFHKHFNILLVALFIILRFSLSAHAVEYGNTSHQHDDKICAISLMPEDEFDDVSTLPPSISLTTKPPGSIFKYQTLTAHNSALPIEANTRGPPQP